MSVPKVYVASGALGFGLSFFTGLLSRASFSVVLLRALVFGVVFVLLSLLAGFLLKRFLPELFEETPEPAAADGPLPGAKLDITIQDEENPPGDAPPAADFLPGNRIPAGNTDSAAPSAETRSAEKGDAGAFSGSAVFPEEGVELDTGFDEPLDSGDSGDTGLDDRADAVFPETDSGAGGTSPAAEPAQKGPRDGLDALPDVSEFVPGGGTEAEDLSDGGGDVFQADTYPAENSPFSGSKHENTPDIDAETMAKAIRTVLSKE